MDIPSTISDAAIKAAIDLVDVCIQHAAFLAGRGEVEDMIDEIAKSKWECCGLLCVCVVVVWVVLCEGLNTCSHVNFFHFLYRVHSFK